MSEDSKKFVKSTAKSLEGLIKGDSVTVEKIYKKLIDLIKDTEEFFFDLEPDFLLNLTIYIFSLKKTGNFDLGDKILKNICFASFICPTGEFRLEECDSCDGIGIEYCSECDSDGNVDCYKCDGNGHIDCNTCGGFGSIQDENSDEDDIDCPNCSGEGKESCDYCDGDGVISCTECGGDGRTTCHNCDGGGEIETTDSVCDMYDVCFWDKNMYDRCELTLNTLETTFTSEEFFRKIRYNKCFIINSKVIEHELSDDLEVDELYCFNLDRNPTIQIKDNKLNIPVTPDNYLN